MFPLPINCDFQLFHRLMMIPLKTQPDKSWKEMVLYAILFPSHMGMTWPQSLNWILLHWREQTHWYQGDQSAKMLLSWWIHIYLFIYFRLLCFAFPDCQTEVLLHVYCMSLPSSSCYLDLFLVVPSSTPQLHCVNNQLVSLLPVRIHYSLHSISNICLVIIYIVPN